MVLKMFYLAFFVLQVRLPTQSKNERNFHIFYQMCRGGSDEEKEHWELEGGKLEVEGMASTVLVRLFGEGHAPHGLFTSLC